MALTGNEVAATNQQRRTEELSESPVGNLIESGLPVTAAAVSLGTALVSGDPTGLVVAGSIVAGLGIVDWFRKLGTSKVSENLEALGQATEDALNRVENVLREHGTSIDEIKRRLESEEFRNAMASASLQALRTTQKDRLNRMALILANGVKDTNPAAESTDDMMRAAVELTEHDVKVLGSIYGMQFHLFSPSELGKDYSFRHQNLNSRWTQWWQDGGAVYRVDGGMAFRSSCTRLQAAGLIASMGTNSILDGPSISNYELLAEGKKFYERLQENATE